MRPRPHQLSLFIATLLLSVISPAELAGNFIGISTASAQTQTTQVRNAKALRLYQTGVQQFRRGQFLEALETFQQVLVIVREIGERQGEGWTLKNIGEVYDNLGQYPKALEFYQQSLAIHKQLGDKAGEGATLNDIGLVYHKLGQYPEALEFYQHALAIVKQIGNQVGVGQTALNNIGGVYYRLDQYPKALEFYQQALVISKQIGDRAGEGQTLNNMGLVYHKLGQYSKALESYQHALIIVKQIGDKAGEGLTLNNIAAVYHNQSQYPKALEFYQQALAIVKQIGDKAGEGLTLNNIGFLYNALGKYPDAEKNLFAGIKVWESLRLGLKDDQKISIFETQVGSYVFLQQALVAQNKTNKALEVTERGRARAFVELLASRLSSNPNNQLTIEPLTIGQIQQIARVQNATLVEYSTMGNRALYIWAIKPTGEVVFKQVDLKKFLNTSLEAFVASNRESIGVRGRSIAVVPTAPEDGNRQTKQLQQLHKLLIEPIAHLLPTDPAARVIFIPQESLFLVPFPALQDASGKYLIEKHTILTAPAIQVLDLTHEQRRDVQDSVKDVLVVGNPTMPKIQIGELVEQLKPLPDAEQEALKIANLLDTQAITGSFATKAVIKQRMPSARIIHFATHGLLDDFKGLGVPGAIALAPSGDDDGLLTAGEILDLKLSAELVVLSACDTGRGRITGDGVIGLSRSLISAGVPSVMVSLWSVPDNSTAFLMTEFYRHLQQNRDNASALRQAMLTTMKQHPNPIDWAAFTLIGEAE